MPVGVVQKTRRAEKVRAFAFLPADALGGGVDLQAVPLPGESLGAHVHVRVVAGHDVGQRYRHVQALQPRLEVLS